MHVKRCTGEPLVVPPADDHGPVETGLVHDVEEVLGGVDVGGVELADRPRQVGDGVQQVAELDRLERLLTPENSKVGRKCFI